MDRIVNFAVRDKVDYLPVKDTYEVLKHNKLINWIIRQLVKRKIIKESFVQQTNIRRVVINKDKVFDLIREQLDNQVRRGKWPTRVYLGYDAMRKLEIDYLESMRFNMDAYYMRDGIKKIMGLEIETVPHMDGVLVI